jgi:aminoglycoside phosphotransferase (APT) family kinase protein
MNAIFAAGDVVLRVSAPTAPAMASIELTDVLAEAGLRVPTPARHEVVEVDDVSVTAWVRLVPSGDPIDWVAVGRMVRVVHDLDPAMLPDSVPLPRASAFPWWDFDELLGRVSDLIDPSAREGLVAALDRHRGWEDFDHAVVCHGDVHPGNVVMDARGPVLIDWDLLCSAPPGWDHAPMLTWAERWGGDPRDYADFAVGYGASLADDPTALALAELRLVAATLLRLDAARRDPTALPEARRRLAHWRGDPDAPAWQAQ